jgi:hypothetical protein
MNNSTKIIMKIMLGSAGLAGVFGIIFWLAGAGGDSLPGGIAAFFAVIAGITFIAFLTSLIVSSSKGQ